MAIDYTKALALAVKLIGENGRAIHVLKIGGAAADPAKPWAGAGPDAVVSDVATLGTFVSASISASKLGHGIVSDDLLARVDQVVMIAGNVNIDDHNVILDTDGSRWRIDFLQLLKPGPISIMYYAGVNR